MCQQLQSGTSGYEREHTEFEGLLSRQTYRYNDGVHGSGVGNVDHGTESWHLFVSSSGKEVPGWKRKSKFKSELFSHKIFVVLIVSDDLLTRKMSFATEIIERNMEFHWQCFFHASVISYIHSDGLLRNWHGLGQTKNAQFLLKKRTSCPPAWTS